MSKPSQKRAPRRTAKPTSESVASAAQLTAKPSLRDVIREAIVEAFFATHDGYSIDWMLANPILQKVYHDACRDAGLMGGPADWNRELLRLRKAGVIPKRGKTIKVHYTDEELDNYNFAAEAAWRLTSDKFDGPSLDEIFCDPEKATFFDRSAKRLAARLRFAPISLGRAPAPQGQPRSGERSKTVSLRVCQTRLLCAFRRGIELNASALGRAAWHLSAARRGQAAPVHRPHA